MSRRTCRSPFVFVSNRITPSKCATASVVMTSLASVPAAAVLKRCSSLRQPRNLLERIMLNAFAKDGIRFATAWRSAPPLDGADACGDDAAVAGEVHTLPQVLPRLLRRG